MQLVPDANLRTAEISDAHNLGQHTTTFSEMIPMGGGWLIDTPGIKGFGTFDIEPEELTSYFPEIFKFSQDCRFSNSPKTAVSPTVPTPTNPAVRCSRHSRITISPKAAISRISP